MLETGYSSWNEAIASEADQAKWMGVSIPAMMELYNSSSSSGVFELINFYQLLDGVSKQFPPQEASFGVMRPPPSFEHKPAFATLKAQISKFAALTLQPSL